MHIRATMAVVLGVVLLAGGLLSGCCLLTSSSPVDHLTVLAGSELKDLEPLFDQITKHTGVSLQMHYIGTLDGAEKLIAGEKYDLAWFSHAKYLTLLQGADSRTAAQEKIMLSPVVLGVKESKAREWGWIDNPDVTWQDVVDKAASGGLRYGMTNPSSSNTGFTALVGAASALSGKADALQLADIQAVKEPLRRFFTGLALTAGSSGWLADSYVQQQDHLDGLINYESVLLGMNQQGELDEPLVLIYPKEGIITADYPLLLIDAGKRAQYDKLVEYLRSAEFQQTMMERTMRRPVNPEVKLSSVFPDRLLVELSFPSSLEVIDSLIFSCLDEQRQPSHAVYVLDVSGSMAGDRIAELKGALTNLTGADTSLTGRFARFRDRERVTLVPFSSSVLYIHDFDVQVSDPASVEAIRAYVDALEAGGDTAIYSALQEAYQIAARAYEQEPDRYYSIVLMSDGQVNTGISAADFEAYFRSLPEDVRQIKTFAVTFGDADADTMTGIATKTGGRAFDAKSESLGFVFKEIRGYQ